MGKSKERAGGYNPRGDTEFAGDHGVDAATENRFFDNRGHESAQGHEHENALRTTHKFFHGHVRFVTDEVSQPSRHHGQSKAAKNVAQYDGAARGHVAETSPTHRLPKWRCAAPPNHNVQKR